MNMYLEAMLIFIEALALSPDNINKLIKELELYPELEGRVASSDIIEKFKKNYTLSYDYTQVPNKYGKTEDIITGFTFSFDHADGRKSYYIFSLARDGLPSPGWLSNASATDLTMGYITAPALAVMLGMAGARTPCE